jgi:hypothetical protein
MDSLQKEAEATERAIDIIKAGPPDSQRQLPE